MKKNAPRVGGSQSFGRSPPSCCRNKNSLALYQIFQSGASAAGCNDARLAWPSRTDPQTWSDRADAQRASQTQQARLVLPLDQKRAFTVIQSGDLPHNAQD